jgi:kinesin family member 5
MEAVTVVARFRGAESGMDDFGEWSLTENTIKHNEKHHEFNFDAVLNPSKTQSELYEAAGRKIISFFMDGYNATIFAYGQSGSGKTFSMLGPEEVTEILVNKSESIPPEVEALFGILPRSTFQIFETVKEGQEKGTKFEVRVSYIEVYNEAINDILACPPNVNLKLREFPNQGMCVIGMLETVANTPEAVFEAISAGTANRIVCSTGQNARSSRSHTVFIISLDQVLLDGTVKKSKINLVDLAGSEKLSKTGAQGQALKEAQKINLSLTTLGRCIKALTSGGGEHVPYRESKLTLILKESLSGSAMTTLIVTGSMRKIHQEETIGTMQFAERAKMVKTAAKSNAKRSYDELERLVQRLTEEVNSLKSGIISGGSDSISTSLSSNFGSVEFEELKVKYETLEESSVKQIEELRHALERAESKMGNIDYLAIHEEMESYKDRIEEDSLQIKNLLSEKDSQRIEFEKKITGLKSTLEETSIKLAQAHNEIQINNKALVSLKQDLSLKDSEVFKLNQQIQDYLSSDQKLKDEISTLASQLESSTAKKNEIESELQSLNAKLLESDNLRSKAELSLNKLEEESQELLAKISLLEKAETQYSEEISNLKAESDDSKKSLRQLQIEIENHKNEAKIAELENLRIKEELISEQQVLQQEVKKLKTELESLQTANNDNIQDEKEKYATEMTNIYKEQLARVKEEKYQLINHIQEISNQLEKKKIENENLIKDSNEIKEKHKDLDSKFNKVVKELDDEKSSKLRLFKNLKAIEDTQEKAIIEAENRVKAEMQLSITAFVQQDNEMRNEIEHKEHLIKKLKENNDIEIEKLKSELIVFKKEKFDRENQIKDLQGQLSSKLEQFFEEKKLLQSTIGEKNAEINKLKELISSQETKLGESEAQINKLQADVKQKTSERDIERKNSIIRQTLIPKRGSIFNKSTAPNPQKGKLPEFILKKTDSKFLKDAIKEAEAISKSAPGRDTYNVVYELQAIKSLYANIDDYISDPKDIPEKFEEEEEEKV